MHQKAALQIHLILMWIRILGSTFGNSGSGSWDPHLGIVDPDPQINLFVIVDLDPRIHIWKKWILIRVQSESESEYLFFDYEYWFGLVATIRLEL